MWWWFTSETFCGLILFKVKVWIHRVAYGLYTRPHCHCLSPRFPPAHQAPAALLTDLEHTRHVQPLVPLHLLFSAFKSSSHKYPHGSFTHFLHVFTHLWLFQWALTCTFPTHMHTAIPFPGFIFYLSVYTSLIRLFYLSVFCVISLLHKMLVS